MITGETADMVRVLAVTHNQLLAPPLKFHKKNNTQGGDLKSVEKVKDPGVTSSNSDISLAISAV